MKNSFKNSFKRKRQQNTPEITHIARIEKLINMFLAVSLIVFLSLSMISLLAGCSSKSEGKGLSETVQESTSSATSSAGSSSSESTGASGAAEETTDQSLKGSQDTESEEGSDEESTESSEQIPQEIADLITSADKYYSDGEYGLAKNTYRKAELAIGDSELSEKTKEELLGSFYEKYNKSKKIIENSRLHYSNAMQLVYETRYEEAKKELEAALALYPKYEEAVEAYEDLKALMGLE